MANILVIDDDPQVCETMQRIMARMRLESETAKTLGEGLAKLREGDFDVVFLDVRLPDGNGLDVLPEIIGAPSQPEVIILTGKGDPDGAELAIQGGVWDYLVKPSSIKNTMLSLERALKYRKEKLAERAPAPLNLEWVVGLSPRMKASFDLLAQAARSTANVLITGETGTGKELFARTIHVNSARATANFVAVDCAALTESLVESALFGHKKGAFTSASRDSMGLIRAADGGTLFLDEVGELSLSIQKAFLRVLQEKRFRPVGEVRELTSNFRLIAATNRSLPRMVEEGTFRQDLLYRLKTIQIELPALRERPQDIKPLAMFRINALCEEYAQPKKSFDPEFLDYLMAYRWPGNVRELFNVLETAFVAAGKSEALYAMHLPQDIRIAVTRQSLRREQVPSESAPGAAGAAEPGPLAREALGQDTVGTASAVRESPFGNGAAEGKAALSGPEPAPGEPAVPVALPGAPGTPAWGIRGGLVAPPADGPLDRSLKAFKSEMERAYLERLIEDVGGDVDRMIEVSGVSKSHLYALLKKNGLSLKS